MTIPTVSDQQVPAISDYLVVEPNGGERLRFLGASTMRLKLDDSRSAGDVAFYEYVSEPGVSGAPQHVHHAHDETFYVVDGMYEFSIGRETISLTKGGFLFVPRETPHAFRNCGNDLGCIVGTFTPGRFSDYFRELAQIIERTGAAPDNPTWCELYGRYDTTFYDNP